MLDIMNEITKKALEYGLSFVLLCGMVYYLHDAMKAQKAEFTAKIEAIQNRLESCEQDKLHLSTLVSELRVQVESITAPTVITRRTNKIKK